VHGYGNAWLQSLHYACGLRGVYCEESSHREEEYVYLAYLPRSGCVRVAKIARMGDLSPSASTMKKRFLPLWLPFDPS
jgi:hypothetical protein